MVVYREYAVPCVRWARHARRRDRRRTSMFGAVWAQAEARKVLGALGAGVIDCELPVARADEALDEDGALRDPQQRADLADILGRLAHAVAEPAVKAA